MQRLIEVARQWGIGELVGDVLSDNGPMLAMCRELGFTIARDPGDASILRVKKPTPPGTTDLRGIPGEIPAPATRDLSQIRARRPTTASAWSDHFAASGSALWMPRRPFGSCCSSA
jgi:hypothetical protein